MSRSRHNHTRRPRSGRSHVGHGSSSPRDGLTTGHHEGTPSPRPTKRGRGRGSGAARCGPAARCRWWSLPDSNRRHFACKANALPAELRPRDRRGPTLLASQRIRPGRAERQGTVRAPAHLRVGGRHKLRPGEATVDGDRFVARVARYVKRRRRCRPAARRSSAPCWSAGSRSPPRPPSCRRVRRLPRPPPWCRRRGTRAPGRLRARA